MDSDEELRRLRANHDLFKDAMGGQLVLAPLDFNADTQFTVLDSATADGTWLRDFVSSLPAEIRDKAKFFGTDVV